MHIRVRKVALGLFHTVALCDRGADHGFGQNPQIGAPKDVKYSTVPILLEGGDLKEDEDDIEFISCGSRHTLVATKHTAFAFGCNAEASVRLTHEEDDERKDEDEDIYLPRETLSTMSAKATPNTFHSMRTMEFFRPSRKEDDDTIGRDDALERHF